VGDEPIRRPRIEGARQREIFRATTQLLRETGYDQLTLDAVAAQAKVSKASIYRLWGDKSALVNAAIECRGEDAVSLPDTGSVIDDVSALATTEGFFDADRASVISGLATAIHRDPERHDAARRTLVDDGTRHVRGLLQRAVDRGELSRDTDIDLLSSVIPAMVLFRMTYQTVGTFSSDFVHDVVAKILTPVLQHQLDNGSKTPHGPASRR
jgi:AcrR family transcriptional regulator